MSFQREDAGVFTNITTQTTTQVKTGKGVLMRLVMNAAAANGVITIYDNVGADTTTPIAIITSPATLLANHFFIDYNLQFDVGLKIVTATANQNITVVWK